MVVFVLGNHDELRILVLLGFLARRDACLSYLVSATFLANALVSSTKILLMLCGLSH